MLHRLSRLLALFLSCAALGVAQPDSASPGAEVLPLNKVSDERLQREIVVGAYSTNYPYSYSAGEDGPLVGFTVELLDELAAAMHLHLRRVALPNAEVQRRFLAGEFDMLQMISESSTREDWADFSVPLLYVQNVLFVRRDAAGVRRLADLRGRRFVVTGTHSASELFLRTWDPAVDLVNVGTGDEALRLVGSGRADAVLLSRLTALSLIDHLQLENVVELKDPAAYLEIRHCFAVHKGDTLLLARLNEGLAVLHTTGAYERIYRKWFGRYEEDRLTRDEVLMAVALALGLAFVTALWGFLRQRRLRRRVLRQSQALVEQEGLLHALYDNVPMGMGVLVMDGKEPRILSLNRYGRGLLGVDGELSPGRVLGTVLHDAEWRDCLASVLAGWRAGAAPEVLERTMAGGRLRVVFTLVPLQAGPGEGGRLCLLIQDVTERRRSEEELARSRRLRALGELVGGIAHEFNNLMTPVLLTASEHRMPGHLPPTTEEMEIIGGAAQRAAELTRRLLTFGRTASSGADAVRLRDAVESSLKLLRPASDRRIVLENRVSGELPPLFFNTTDLHQILFNLLLNARDTVAEKLVANSSDSWTPCIRIEGRAYSVGEAGLPPPPAGATLLGWQRVSVHDNGRGMPPEVRERIFEPFFTTKNVGKGTGLGLATVWHLVTAAGGRVDVETVAGAGTTFHVWLPVHPVPKVEFLTPAGRTLESAVGARILVVDDEELVVRSIGAALRREGYVVGTCADGAQAWEHLRRNLGDYALLIVDLNLPGLSGFEVVRRARQAGYAGKVIVVSGRAAAGRAPMPGVDRNLPKPFTAQELIEAVNAGLAD